MNKKYTIFEGNMINITHNMESKPIKLSNKKSFEYRNFKWVYWLVPAGIYVLTNEDYKFQYIKTSFKHIKEMCADFPLTLEEYKKNYQTLIKNFANIFFVDDNEALLNLNSNIGEVKVLANIKLVLIKNG